ncbi:MAG: hypothetical protein OEN50_05560 [Deltaproteobacteria bacterium]|nr:hypothetical protein [Deltaproteobacteria bacterium]
MIWAPAACAQATIDYARNRANVVLKITEVLGEIKDPDAGPFVQVHGDGYVLVHYPRYMKRAGDYFLQLSQQEMADLMGLLSNRKILEFDVDEVRRDKRQADRAVLSGSAPQLFAVLDASTTIIEIRVDRYNPVTGKGQEVLNVDKKISWYGLKSDAKRYPDIEPIQNLDFVRQRLLTLMEHKDLEKIP